MNEKLLKVVDLLCGKGFRLVLYTDSNDRYNVIVPIGSKTGEGWLYCENGDVVLETRYNKKNILTESDPINDIAWVAWGWYIDYKDRGYDGPSSDWLPIWKEMGLISLKTVTSTEYVIH